MSKPWGGVGAWALEAERAEAEDRERVAASISYSGSATFLAGEAAQSFPSLKDAATKSKKKKGVSLTLSEFTTGTYVGPGGARRDPVFEPKGLTPDEMLRLPTGPRERTEEELEHSRLGGGFRSYGHGHGGGGGAAPPRRRSDFVMDDEPRRGQPASRASDLDLFSRADEVDNWATTKKSFIPTMDSGRQERYGSLGSGGSSKADDDDNWSSGKKSIAPPPSSRYSSVGSGFRDSLGSGPVSDRWVRGGGGGSLSSNGERVRPRLVLDPPKGDSGSHSEAARRRPSPFGAARPREEVLAKKGLDWRKMETEADTKKNARPTSSQSSRPSSAHSSTPGSPVSQVSGGGAPKPHPKVNPFGDAKPREVLLEEKGMDWRKIDQELDHHRVDRPETDEEKMLNEEIHHLKKELAKETESKPDYDFTGNFAEPIKTLHEQIRLREKELDQLIRDLNDKVRLGQRASADVRPGSGAGRIPFSPDRPSEFGISEDLIHMDFKERPRSRGSADSWGRPKDDLRGFNSGKDSGFPASGSIARSKPRERW